MTDIVERLRDIHAGTPLDVACKLDDLCQEAATAIASMREERDKTRAAVFETLKVLRAEDDSDCQVNAERKAGWHAAILSFALEFAEQCSAAGIPNEQLSAAPEK